MSGSRIACRPGAGAGMPRTGSGIAKLHHLRWASGPWREVTDRCRITVRRRKMTRALTQSLTFCSLALVGAAGALWIYEITLPYRLSAEQQYLLGIAAESQFFTSMTAVVLGVGANLINRVLRAPKARCGGLAVSAALIVLVLGIVTPQVHSLSHEPTIAERQARRL